LAPVELLPAGMDPSIHSDVFAAPTAIAGIYGMNVQFMPELGWRYGHEATLGGMAVLCGALWVGFKRSGWL
jgi:magnesium transporter